MIVVLGAFIFGLDVAFTNLLKLVMDVGCLIRRKADLGNGLLRRNEECLMNPDGTLSIPIPGMRTK